MNQRDIQVWNDAVEACRVAAVGEVNKIEGESAYGMPSVARRVVRAIGHITKQGDNRSVIHGIDPDDFPKA